MKATRTVVSIVVLVAMGWCSTAAWGDPLPGRDILKFQQKPLNGLAVEGVKYWGHDEVSTAYWNVNAGTVPLYQGQYMADDFADKFNTPVVHVKWWGSYLNEQEADERVRRFLIAFEKDIPADPLNGVPSHPGEVLQTQIVTLGPLAPSSGTFTETMITPAPPAAESLYEYNAELEWDFDQQPDTVYWLKIVALVDVSPDGTGAVPPVWGWHNRDYSVMDPVASTAPAVAPGEALVGKLIDGTEIWHFQDDAVAGNVDIEVFGPGLDEQFVIQPDFEPQHYIPPFDGPSQIIEYSKDLAFELYTVPEPASMALLAIGAVGVLVRRRRR